MINTDIKAFVECKNKEHIELQKLLLKASASKESVVYHKFNYSSNFLIGKIKKVEMQIKGAINMVEKVGQDKWNLLNLYFIEHLAKEEFIYHVAIDSKYYNIVSEKLLDKIITSYSDKDFLEINLKRLTNIKDKLMFNLRRYNDIDYKNEWIRDRYFEIASFIDFEEDFSVIDNGLEKENTIYDIVISGEKTIDDMKKGGIYYDVLKIKFDFIKDAVEKDLSYLINEKKNNIVQ